MAFLFCPSCPFVPFVPFVVTSGLPETLLNTPMQPTDFGASPDAHTASLVATRSTSSTLVTPCATSP
jgi:hypothetical protein